MAGCVAWGRTQLWRHPSFWNEDDAEELPNQVIEDPRIAGTERHIYNSIAAQTTPFVASLDEHTVNVGPLATSGGARRDAFKRCISKPSGCISGFGWQDTHDAYNTCGKLRLGTERVICGLDVIACERRVTQRLALARLEMSSTLRSGPGGNSLFEAFSQAVWGAPHYHTLLRQMIIKYMREDEDARAEYQTILGDDYDAYLTWMQQQGTAGDELTLRVLADRFGLPVTVITGDEVVWCVRYPPRRCRSKREIFLVSVPTGRFAAIRRQSAITTIRLTLTSSHEEKRVKEQRKKLTPYGAGALSATA